MQQKSTLSLAAQYSRLWVLLFFLLFFLLTQFPDQKKTALTLLVSWSENWCKNEMTWPRIAELNPGYFPLVPSAEQRSDMIMRRLQNVGSVSLIQLPLQEPHMNDPAEEAGGWNTFAEQTNRSHDECGCFSSSLIFSQVVLLVLKWHRLQLCFCLWFI